MGFERTATATSLYLPHDKRARATAHCGSVRKPNPDERWKKAQAPTITNGNLTIVVLTLQAVTEYRP